MKTTLLEQLAQEVFREGRPLNEIVADLVENKYNYALSQVKTLIREGKDFTTIRDALIEDGAPLKTATSLVFTAQHEVATEIANEKRLARATETAQALFKNGCRFDDVVNNLKGFAPDIADKVAKDNQHFYR